MPGAAKDKKATKNDRSKYENTQQTETYRQQLTKETKILAPRTKLDIEKLDPYFTVNNNYVGMFKQDEGKQDNSKSVAYSHPMDRLGIVENDFCQKCKKDKGFCPHKQGQQNATIKDQFKFPIISSSSYGWREPIDNPNWGYGIREAFQVQNYQFRAVEKPNSKENKK
ncbi:hypothetical protein pb186bvf_010191 [Paramecium bursaria]